MRARRAPHVQLHLPPMTGAQACLLVAVLERAVAAVWRAHGDEMAIAQGRAFADIPTHANAVASTERRHADEADPF